MAKKKKSKNTKENFSYSVELTGLTLILIGIIGFGFGPIGTLIKKFSLFLGGTYWFLILITILGIGVYMLIQRKMPKFYTPTMIGIYILICTLLAYNHIGFLDQEMATKEIFNSTYNNFISRMNTINTSNALTSSGTSSIVIGGGLIGCFFICICNLIGGAIGAKIILFIATIFGLILTFDLNISQMFQNIGTFFSNMTEDDDEAPEKEKKEKKKKEKPIKNTSEDENDDNYEIPQVEDEVVIKAPKKEIIVNSIDNLKNPSKADIVEDEIIKEETITPSSEIITREEPLPQTNAYSLTSSTPTNTDGYKLPGINILKKSTVTNAVNTNTTELKQNKTALKAVLNDFGIVADIKDTHVGPAVTQFEIKVPNGTKVNKILSINKEIALAMAAKDVRIQAPIPGKSTIGIELPNGSITAVGFREVLENAIGKEDDKLYVALGKDLMGKCIIEDLTKMPHLLVAGSTGSGKSVCINTMISSILMRYKPSDVKLVMVDPKKVELTNYNGIPHLLCPVVSDPKKASVTLQKIVAEMDKRYDIFSDSGVKNISGYNEQIAKKNETIKENPLIKMPYILVIIDELADLMLVASKEVEDSIMRITQMARAAGIHLIVATQRPSTDVITGLIKNNIPSRIAFAVSSGIDSRTILDSTGAEKLLGKGDMLYLPMGESTPTRVQGCYVSDDEIKDLIDHCCSQMQASYDETLMNVESNAQSSGSANSEGDEDVMYDEVVEFAIESGKISASLIQRRFRFGYNRAARMIDILESRGIVGPQNGSKPREVLIKEEKNE